MTDRGAIDLGSTNIKVARLTSDGHMTLIARYPAPKPKGRGSVRESDAQAWLDAAYNGLRAAREAGIKRLGLSVQRSSFAVWRESDGKPLSALISWRDTRGQSWCDQNADQVARIKEHTGIVPSPHYLGPKVASLCKERHPAFASLQGGGSIVGTLDAAVLYRWSHSKNLVTAPCVAARTLLLDPVTAHWDPELLALFRVPRTCLPNILTANDLPLFVSGVHIHSVLADQSAAFLAMRHQFPRMPIINAGTGTFIMTERDDPPPIGYLRMAFWDHMQGPNWCWEATVNAGAKIFPELAGVHSRRSELRVDDLASPEVVGYGTPFLDRGAPPISFVRDTQAAAVAYAFRIRAILDDFDVAADMPVILGGGCSRNPSAVQGFADIIERKVYRLDEADLSAYGAIQQIDPQAPLAPLTYREVAPRSASWTPLYDEWRQNHPLFTDVSKK
ncbi:MAG: hypothetical protein KDC35_06775 [Acidobacteria bacterium]|nr:hypothetical protein [Acidobacteriota bacterium]